MPKEIPKSNEVTGDVPFKDIPSDAWHRKSVSIYWGFQYIETAKKQGAISGYPDGAFYPEKQTTRAEIATVVAKMKKLTPFLGNFKDISTHWARDSINACSSAHIMAGYSDYTFRPSFSATRAEVTVIVARMLK